MNALDLLGYGLAIIGALACLEAAVQHWQRKAKARRIFNRVVEADVYGRNKELRPR